MIKEFIGTGATVEEAMASAKAGLNAPAMASVSVEVISMPKKKILGLFGGQPAQVKAWFDDGVKEKKPQPRREAPKKEAPKKSERKPLPKKENNKKPEAPKAAAPAPEKEPKEKKDVAVESDINAQLAVDYLNSILNGLNVEDAKITTSFADGVLEMNVECDNYGIIIGRRGDTLDSIQYLTSLVLKRSCEKSVRVSINVGNYREKRAETLKGVATKNANYVLRTGRRFTFEPMNPYERRIIHTTVQEIEGVESLSVGYGQDRKVVIQPVGGAKYRPRREAQRREAPAQQKVASKADRSFTKFGKIEVNKD